MAPDSETVPATQAEPEPIDFTMMYVTHEALRRDVGRLSAAVRAGRADTPGVRAGWANFTAQLHVHHSVEDDELWPRLRAAVAGRPEEMALVTEMAAEHAALDPVLSAVDAALGDGDASPSLVDRVEELATVLKAHLGHEERSALPLIQAVLTPADWRGFGAAMRRRQGLKGAAMYVPWIVDGASAGDRRRFFAVLPPPLRPTNRLIFEPRYRRAGLWADR